MIKIEFAFNEIITPIECHIYDYMQNIIQNFSSITKMDIEHLSFNYNGYEINKELTLEENIYLNKEDKIIDEIITINVYNKERNKTEKKAKNTIENTKLNEEYINKINYKFKKCPNLKYKLDITDENDLYGRNDLFEVFVSYKDNKEYIVSKNFFNHNLDVFNLVENKKILSLKGHDNNITTIRYFINDKNKNEYLISADFNYYIIIWDISNNYDIKYKFYSGYQGNIYSCLLVFPYKRNNNNYFITSTRAKIYNNHEDQYTKLYSLDTGKFIKNFDLTNNIRIFYLLLWFNKNDSEYYVIQLGTDILISCIFSDNYFSLDYEYEGDYLSGFIYEKNNIDYLCVSSLGGAIIIFDLYNRKLFKVISCNENHFWHIIQWNEKYSIVSDRMNRAFKIIDMEKYQIISNIGGEHKKDVLCVKKIFHPIYGESLLSCAEDNTIKLWVV